MASAEDMEPEDPETPARTNKCDYDVPISTLQNLLDNAKTSVGLLRVPSMPPDLCPPQGTISLYKISKNIFGLITNNHMMPRTDNEFICGSYINFEGFGRLVLSNEDIECVTTNEELDATIIELTEQCVALLTQRGAKFLEIASARLQDQVAMVHHSNDVFAFDKGIVHDIKDNILYYYLGGDFESSGSPILLWNLQAIGLHRHSNRKKSHTILGAIRIATHLPDVVNFHIGARLAPQM